jgi:hypothetical protein
MLTGLLTKVIVSLFSAIAGWLMRHFQEWLKDRKEAAADEKKTADAIQAVKDAKTKEEIDNAAKGIADNL